MTPARHQKELVVDGRVEMHGAKKDLEEKHVDARRLAQLLSSREFLMYVYLSMHKYCACYVLTKHSMH